MQLGEQGIGMLQLGTPPANNDMGHGLPLPTTQSNPRSLSFMLATTGLVPQKCDFAVTAFLVAPDPSQRAVRALGIILIVMTISLASRPTDSQGRQDHTKAKDLI